MNSKFTRTQQGNHSNPRNYDSKESFFINSYNPNMHFHQGPLPSSVHHQHNPQNKQLLPAGASQETYMLSPDLAFRQYKHQHYSGYEQELRSSEHPVSYHRHSSPNDRQQKRMNKSHTTQEHRNVLKEQRFLKSGSICARENKPKMLCLTCSRCFDLNARMPLILRCSHLMCEDCLQSKKTAEGVQLECVECKVDVSLKLKLKTDFVITDYFPINYYIVGKLYCKRQNQRHVNPLQFIAEEARENSSKHLPTEECKAAGCKNSATLHCRDCEEDYCNSCCGNLHKTANGLEKHNVFSISITQCTVHGGQPFEYSCNTCSESCCTYCIIEEHKDHSFKQVTKLEPADEDKFSKLVENCNQMLQKLECTQKIVHAKISKQPPYQLSKGLEKKILKCFNEIHGKLQQIEANLLLEAISSSNASLESLKEAEFQLQRNIASVKELLEVGNQILKHEKLGSWQNVDLFMQRMVNAQKLPCLLEMKENLFSGHRIDFEYIDFTSDLSKHFKINGSPGNTFQLVNGETSSIANDISEATSEASKNNIGIYTKKSVMINRQNQEHPLRIRNQKIELHSESVSGNDDLVDTFTSISRTNFTLDSSENVLVTHFISPEKFYVQFIKHNKVIQQMHKEISHMVDQLYVSSVNNPIQDKLYLVKSTSGIVHCWRRALVSKVIPQRSECFVNYIDYGNSDTVLFNDMRTITDNLSIIVPLAFECKLYDIYEPPNAPWSDEDATLISEMLCGANLTIIMKSSNLIGFEVDLQVFTPYEEFYLRSALLFMGRGVCNNDNNEILVDIVEPEQPSRNVYSMAQINSDNLVDLVHIENSITIFIRDHNYKDSYRSLSRSLSDFLNNPINNSAGKIYLPQVGNAVALRLIEEDDSSIQWYRGLVLDVQTGTGFITVQQVDTGHESLLSYNCLRSMPKQFLKYPKMARKVRLMHVTYCNEDENKSGIAFLKRLKDVPLKVELNNKAYDSEIILWEPFGTYDLCVNTQLVLNAGLRSIGFMSTMLKRYQEEPTHAPEESLISNLMRLSQGKTHPIEDECDSGEEYSDLEQVPVKVVQVVSPDCIYLHLKEDVTFSNDLKQFELKLQAHCNSIFVTRNTWTVGNHCAAYNRKLMNYSRVEIVQCLDNNRFEVIGLDHRNTFQTECETLAELSEEFSVIPPKALKVHLHGVKPMGAKWSLTSTDLLKDLLVQKNDIYMTAMKITDFTSDLPVLLWIKKSRHGTALEQTKVCKINVSKILSKNGLGILSKDLNLSPSSNTRRASIVQDLVYTDDKIISNISPKAGRQNLHAQNDEFNWLPAKPITESSFQAIATNVDDTGYIYFHYPEEITLLNEMEDRMFQLFQFVKPSLPYAWEIGNACTVKYHQNHKFYRGEIVDSDEAGKELRIRMIDYGNVEDCKYNEVWKEIHYKNVPRIAKIIQLEGILEHKEEYPLSVLDAMHLLVVEKVLDVKVVEMADKSHPASAWVKQGSIEVNKLVQRSLKIYIGNRQKYTTQSIKAAGNPSSSEDVEEDVIIEKVIYNSCKVGRCEAPIPLSASTSVTNYDNQFLNDLKYKYRDLPSTELFEAHVIGTLSTNRIVFEVEHELDPKFEDLQKDINARWREQPVIKNLFEDQVCIARYSNDSTWYRAKIITLDGKNIVHFVDFGNAEELASPNIREIKSEWLAMPVTQYLAVLSDFKLWVEGHELFVNAVISHLESYLESAFLVKVTCNEPLSVKLYNPDTKELAYKKLFESKILQKED